MNITATASVANRNASRQTVAKTNAGGIGTITGIIAIIPSDANPATASQTSGIGNGQTGRVRRHMRHPRLACSATFIGRPNRSMNPRAAVTS